MREYSQLTDEDRIEIYAMKQAGKAVEKTIVSLMDLLPRRSYTLTVDNGKEFASHEAVADALRIKVYFADPYCPCSVG